MKTFFLWLKAILYPEWMRFGWDWWHDFELKRDPNQNTRWFYVKAENHFIASGNHILPMIGEKHPDADVYCRTIDIVHVLPALFFVTATYERKDSSDE